MIFSQADPGDALMGSSPDECGSAPAPPTASEVFSNIMEPGDTFGEIALLDGRPRTAGAVAMAPSDLLVIRRGQFLGLLAREPELACTCCNSCARACAG